MKASGLLIAAAGCLGAVVVLGQGQAPAQAPANPAAPAAAAAPLQQGPGVQSANDARYREFVNTKCKNPPQPRGGGAGGGRGGGGAAAPAAPIHRDVKVTEIPGVIAAGQEWKTVWTGRGNNADGILDSDGAMLAAQNTDSKVMRIDRNGKVSFPYSGTNTGGALSMNKKGALFVIERGLPTGILQLKPKRQTLANMYNGEPFECTGSGTNDLTADSKGGVYFTMGGLYYANPKGVVTKHGTLNTVNGLILSADEKTLYVTGRLTPAPAPAGGGAGGPGAGAGGGRGGAAAPPAPPGPSAHVGVVAFDVQPDGSLTNEREFAKVGNDGATIDSQGRVYVTGGLGVQVLGPDGKLLGEIPAPLNLITAAFSGKDKKTLYGVANNQQFVEIFAIQMIAQGYKGRAK
jgi:sugar lactone lactonase YvrE